ncbi:glycosyltransferase family 2 protein [Jejudonia soesokkakensis]|uniref:Glycosyltransferase family 2 protein n=1 Tax=Jejudonia soesokkakensis TaxID=1323432 RepID=A0ABW2MT38_9FLAO
MCVFSIIIPTFNSGVTLPIALESIVQQTEQSIEVLIMDCLSTDHTLEIANTYETKFSCMKIISQKDKGIYDAMNKGIDNATGNWILFLGSDDSLYDLSVLETVKKKIDNTNAKVVYGNAKIQGDTGWAKDGEVYAGAFNLSKLLNQNICHQAIFYNKDFIKNEIGYFNLKYTKSSDWDFNLRCWAKSPFQYIDLIVANFKAGGFSTHATDTGILDDFIDNVRRYFGISLFHPLLNNPTFGFYGIVLTKQQEQHPFRFKYEKLKKRFFTKIR